jgi:hypothetical protein
MLHQISFSFSFSSHTTTTTSVVGGGRRAKSYLWHGGGWIIKFLKSTPINMTEQEKAKRKKKKVSSAGEDATWWEKSLSVSFPFEDIKIPLKNS